MKWTEGADFPELWVKDLDSPNPAVRLWDRFWFPGNHVNTWAPLGQNVVWAPRGSDDLFFVRRAASTDLAFEIVQATLDAGLNATMRVLATDRGEQRFLDIAISDDSSSLALVRANRRPYRGGTVQLLDFRQPDVPGKVVFEAAEGAQLYVRGWTRRGTIVALRSFRPDVKNATEVWEIDLTGNRGLSPSRPVYWE